MEHVQRRRVAAKHEAITGSQVLMGSILKGGTWKLTRPAWWRIFLAIVVFPLTVE
jgi:hypothetical protein